MNGKSRAFHILLCLVLLLLHTGVLIALIAPPMRDTAQAFREIFSKDNMQKLMQVSMEESFKSAFKGILNEQLNRLLKEPSDKMPPAQVKKMIVEISGDPPVSRLSEMFQELDDKKLLKIDDDEHFDDVGTASASGESYSPLGSFGLFVIVFGFAGYVLIFSYLIAGLISISRQISSPPPVQSA